MESDDEAVFGDVEGGAGAAAGVDGGAGGGAGTAFGVAGDEGVLARPCRIGRGRWRGLIGSESARSPAAVNSSEATMTVSRHRQSLGRTRRGR